MKCSSFEPFSTVLKVKDIHANAWITLIAIAVVEARKVRAEKSSVNFFFN